MQLDLPSQTLVNRVVPKAALFRRVRVGSKVKQLFTDQIERIVWRHKLSDQTFNTPSTDLVTEIQIFEVQLKQRIIPIRILEFIDKAVQYPVLFGCTFQSEVVYAMFHRRGGVSRLYTSDWNPEIEFRFDGRNLERVYERLILAFVDKTAKQHEQFDQVIETDEKLAYFCKLIVRLESKIRVEKQFKKQVALNQDLNQLKKELAGLQKG